jgi:Peptidase family M23/PGAP1-like protein
MRVRSIVVVLCVAMSSAPVAYAQSSRVPAWMVPPVDGALARPYLAPLGPYAAGHRGIDYSVPVGTLVRATGPGRVAFAGPVAGTQAVTVDHGGGLVSTYSSLSSILVVADETVGRGEWLGRSGAAHEGAAPGLHLGMKLDGEYVDPTAYLGPVGLAGAIHLAPPVWHPPAFLTEGFRSAFDAGSHRTVCRAEPPADAPLAPTENIAVAIAGIGSETRGGNRPELYEDGPERLGYAPESIYRFSYDGPSGPSLHEPYDRISTFGDLRAAARRLRELLVAIGQRHPGRRVDLIAHSQGGIVARVYLASLHRSWDPRVPVVDHLVTFATPHTGAPMSDAIESLEGATLTGRPLVEWLSRRARSNGGWPDPLARSAAQLQTDSRLLGALGREDVSYGTRVLTLGIANDLYAPANRTMVADEQSRVVGPNGLWGHSGILSAGDALGAAHAFLRDGRASCRTGWDLWGPRAGAAIGWVERWVPWAYGELEELLLRRLLPRLGRRRKS